MKAAVVVGAGGHAKVVISTLRAAGYEVSAVVDDDLGKKGQSLLGVPVIGPTSMLLNSEFDAGVIAVGNNRVRERLAATLPLRWLTVIHPAADVDPSARLGAGTVIFANAVVQPDAVIGAHVILNTACSIDHDCVIGDFAHIAPGVNLAGDVRVGRGAFIGIGSVGIPGLRIGAYAEVGAGSVLVRDVPDYGVAYGNPARLARVTGPGCAILPGGEGK